EPVEEQARAIRRNLVAALSDHAVSSKAEKVGNGITAPKLLQKVEVEYSDGARALKVQGPVMLKVVIDTDGLAKDIEVTQPMAFGLDEKAVEAVTQWRFQPGTSGGVPVPVMAQVEVNFRLM